MSRGATALRVLRASTAPLLTLVILAGVAGLPRGAFGQDVAAELPNEVVRPFDKVLLKNGNTIEGAIETPGEWQGLPEIEILDRGGKSRVKIRGEDVKDVVPRQPADQVYERKRKRMAEERDPARRAEAELDIALWCKTPLLALDGAPPRDASALEHLLNAVELNPALEKAYPHLLSVLSAKSGAEGPAGADLDREVRVALLAERGSHHDPAIDFRVGVILLDVIGVPGKAKVYLERALAAGGSNRGEARQARSLLAGIYLAENAPEKAIALYDALQGTLPEGQQTGPEAFEAAYELARLHARSGAPGSLERSRAFFAKAKAIQPDYLEIDVELAALDYRKGDLAGAEKTLKAVLARDAENVPALVNLALVRLRRGLVPQAVKALEALVPKAAGEDLALVRLGLGAACEGQGARAQALEHYQAAAGLDPASADARIALGSALLEVHRPAEARTAAADLLPAARENRWLFAACSRILAEAALADGKAADAAAHLLRAAEVDSDPMLLERTGILLLREGKPDTAYPLLRRARESGGERPDTLNALAAYHYSRGEFDAALKLFESVLKLIPAPGKGTGTAAPPLPPARVYALRGSEMIKDLQRLEVWSADLAGPDGPLLNGWEETQRNGIDISRKDSHIVLAGKQTDSADAVTMALLERPIEGTTFERLALGARIDSGKVRLALRLEGTTSRGGATAGIIFFRDLDGVLRSEVKTSQGDWQAVPVATADAPGSGKLVNPETGRWPDDGGFHVLEIRRSGKAGTSAGGGFDLYFDGEAVAWNVRVAGLGSRHYYVGMSGQTDAIDNEYSITVESFKVYRAKPEAKKNVRR